MFWNVFILVCGLLTPSAYCMDGSFDILERINSGDKNLVGLDLHGVELRDIDLSNADFTDANLSGAKLIHVNLDNARFVRTNLRNAEIAPHKADHILFDHSDLSEAKFIGRLFFENSSISDTNFSHVQFDDVSFFHSTLKNVDFTGARFVNDCGFLESELDHVIMRGAFFQDLSITCCSLDNIDLCESRIEKAWILMFDTPSDKTIPLAISRATWHNIDFSNAIIQNSWFIGGLILFCDKDRVRIPELKSLEMPWYYKLSLFLNPIHAAKRMISDSFDEYNVNSAFVGANFDGAIFLNVAFTNIALKNCLGVDSLNKRRRCLFKNVVIEDTKHNQRYTISDDGYMLLPM